MAKANLLETENYLAKFLKELPARYMKTGPKYASAVKQTIKHRLDEALIPELILKDEQLSVLVREAIGVQAFTFGVDTFKMTEQQFSAYHPILGTSTVAHYCDGSVKNNATLMLKLQRAIATLNSPLAYVYTLDNKSKIFHRNRRHAQAMKNPVPSVDNHYVVDYMSDVRSIDYEDFEKVLDELELANRKYEELMERELNITPDSKAKAAIFNIIADQWIKKLEPLPF